MLVFRFTNEMIPTNCNSHGRIFHLNDFKIIFILVLVYVGNKCRVDIFEVLNDISLEFISPISIKLQPSWVINFDQSKYFGNRNTKSISWCIILICLAIRAELSKIFDSGYNNFIKITNKKTYFHSLIFDDAYYYSHFKVMTYLNRI